MYWLFIGVIFCSQEADFIVVECGLVQNVGRGPVFTSLLLSLARWQHLGGEVPVYRAGLRRVTTDACGDPRGTCHQDTFLHLCEISRSLSGYVRGILLPCQF